MATKTTVNVSNVRAFYPRIEKSIPTDVQRHLRLIYERLVNHAQAFEYVATTRQTTAAATSSAISALAQAASGGGGGGGAPPTSGPAVEPPLVLNYTYVTSAYTIQLSDFQIECNGSFTVTLPTAVGITGQVFSIKNNNPGNITLAAQTGETIDGNATLTLNKGNNDMVMSNGTGWIIIASH